MLLPVDLQRLPPPGPGGLSELVFRRMLAKCVGYQDTPGLVDWRRDPRYHHVRLLNSAFAFLDLAFCHARTHHTCAFLNRDICTSGKTNVSRNNVLATARMHELFHGVGRS